jgi:lysophospholipase L1-like esterase
VVPVTNPVTNKDPSMRKLRTLTRSFLTALASSFAFTWSAQATTKQPDLKDTDVVVFAGDSITWEGQFDDSALGWVLQFSQQAKSKYPHIKIYDSGVGGDTSGKLLNRFQSSVLNVQPTVVVIWVGINDMGHQIPFSTTVANFSKIINLALTGGVREIVLTSPECIGEKPDGQNYYDSQIDQLTSYLYGLALADKTGRVFYCPMRAYWSLEEASVNPEHLGAGVLTVDSVHPTPLGQGFLRNVFSAEFGIGSDSFKPTKPPNFSGPGGG